MTSEIVTSTLQSCFAAPLQRCDSKRRFGASSARETYAARFAAEAAPPLVWLATFAGRLVPMAAAGELVAAASADGQRSADDKGNDAEHPDDREPGYEADD